MPNRKLIQFKVPQGFYEDFYRAFPGHGERARILTKLMRLAIEMADQKDAFIQLIRDEANLEAGE